MVTGETENDPDLELLHAAQAGSEEAYDALMQRRKGALFSLICRYVGSIPDAEEILQDAFVRAYMNLPRFRPEARFTTWLSKIAVNLCRDFLKKRDTRRGKLHVELDDDTGRNEKELQSKAAQPDEAAILVEQVDAVQRAIDHLPFELREPLILTALEGLSHKECAEILGLTPKAVELRVYRARKALEEGVMALAAK